MKIFNIFLTFLIVAAILISAQIYLTGRIHRTRTSVLALRSPDQMTELNTRNQVNFITYGNSKFANSKRRIAKEALQSGWFDDVIALGPENLNEAFRTQFDDILEKPRMGGYGVWKHTIIMQRISKMNDGDFLIYLDAGCTINTAGKPRFDEYLDMLRASDYGIICEILIVVFPVYHHIFPTKQQQNKHVLLSMETNLRFSCYHCTSNVYLHPTTFTYINQLTNQPQTVSDDSDRRDRRDFAQFCGMVHCLST